MEVFSLSAANQTRCVLFVVIEKPPEKSAYKKANSYGLTISSKNVSQLWASEDCTCYINNIGFQLWIHFVCLPIIFVTIVKSLPPCIFTILNYLHRRFTKTHKQDERYTLNLPAVFELTFRSNKLNNAYKQLIKNQCVQ